MKRIKEIITYLMNFDHDEVSDPYSVWDELEDLGYTGEEIQQARSMLDWDESDDMNTMEPEADSKKSRIFSEEEKLNLATDAQGYLIRLKNTGWLSEAQLSLIIENAGMSYSIPVSREEIMDITARYVPEIPTNVLSGLDNSGENIN
ncbi:MAG: DUF494 family protein [Candidatus Krumholzibacteriota bacterium]|nr:DUF494 family protein [Candidatus Krumholzibacteriota bacterium]